MINTFVAASLEKIINHYLRLDPETVERLAEFSGKIILWIIPDWNLQFYLLITHNGVQLLHQYEGFVDTTIKGSPLDLLKSARGENNWKALSIEGDVELGKEFRDILRHMDIDWEEQLAKITGDVAAQHIGNATRKVIQWGKETLNSLQLNVSEYLQEEARLLPTRHEIEDFFEEVSRLRDDVARLEARLNKM